MLAFPKPDLNILSPRDATNTGTSLKVLHIINDLSRGGAETALFRLAERSKQLGDDVSIICLKGEGELGLSLRESGIPVTAIGLSFGRNLPASLFRLRRTIRRERPDVVQTWLYHSNLIGGLVSKLTSPGTPVIWGIHHSILKAESSRRTTILVSRVSAIVSRIVPKRIVYCANISRRSHEAANYDPKRGLVIPNGISLEMFRPNPDARERVRAEIGVDDSLRVIGIVARYHSDKDIPTFVAAAGLLSAQVAVVRFVLVGKDLDSTNAPLLAALEATGYADRFVLLGSRSDVPDVLNAFDIASLSSITEAFPISIIEAMAVGLPFVSTDVGDAAEVIGTTGRVVPVSDPAAMASAWLELLELDREAIQDLGMSARARLRANYQLETTTDMYRNLYMGLTATN